MKTIIDDHFNLKKIKIPLSLKRSMLKFGALFFLFLFNSCTSNRTPQLVIYGKDACQSCHMTITDHRFGGQIITKKGKVYHFDSVNCIFSYLQNHSIDPLNNFTDGEKIYFVNSQKKNEYISSSEVLFGVKQNLRSPMGAGILSFHNNDEHLNTNEFTEKMNWEKLIKALLIGKFK